MDRKKQPDPEEQLIELLREGIRTLPKRSQIKAAASFVDLARQIEIEDSERGSPRDSAVQKLAADKLRELLYVKELSLEEIGQQYGVGREAIRKVARRTMPEYNNKDERKRVKQEMQAKRRQAAS